MKKFSNAFILVFCSIAAHAQFSLEFNAGVERVTAQLKVYKHIDKRKRWSLYTGNQFTVNYDADKPGFTSANVFAYNFRNGVAIGTVLIAGKNGLHPSAGVQYQKTVRSFSIYFLSTFEPAKPVKHENYFFVGYKHRLSNKLKLILLSENYVCLQKWGYDQSLERIKSGVEVGQTQFGVVSETSQKEKSHRTKLVNLGFFIKQSF